MAVHDFLKPPEQALLSRVSKELGLDNPPPDVADALGPSTFFYAFFFLPGRSLTVVGHPPQQRVVEALTLDGLPPKLALGQQDMHSAGTQYELWDFKGSVASFPIASGLGQALKASGMVAPGWTGQ